MKISGFVNIFPQNRQIPVFQRFLYAWEPATTNAPEKTTREGMISGFRTYLRGGGLDKCIDHHDIPQSGADAQGSQEKGAHL